MTHTIQLFLVAIVMLLIGMYIERRLVVRHFKLRSKIVNGKIAENMNTMADTHFQTHQKNLELSGDVEALKVWIADAEIYIQELELENLALNGTKSRATITLPEDETRIKEKKVVHKRTRKAQ